MADWKDVKLPTLDECREVAAGCKTPAGRWAFVELLLNPPYVDECGCPCEGPPLISREMAMELMGFPVDPETD